MQMILNELFHVWLYWLNLILNCVIVFLHILNCFLKILLPIIYKNVNLWINVPGCPALYQVSNKLFQHLYILCVGNGCLTSYNLNSNMRPSKILCTTQIYLSVDTLNYVHWYLAWSDPTVTVILKASSRHVYAARMKTADEEAPSSTRPTKTVCACRLWQSFWLLTWSKAEKKLLKKSCTIWMKLLINRYFDMSRLTPVLFMDSYLKI